MRSFRTRDFFHVTFFSSFFLHFSLLFLDIMTDMYCKGVVLPPDFSQASQREEDREDRADTVPDGD